MRWLKAIFVVLRQGEALSDAKTWKDRHQAINALLAIMAVATPLLAHYGLLISESDSAAIAAGIAALGGIVTAYLVPATSTQAGLPAKPNGDSSAGKFQTESDNIMG